MIALLIGVILIVSLMIPAVSASDGKLNSRDVIALMKAIIAARKTPIECRRSINDTNITTALTRKWGQLS